MLAGEPNERQTFYLFKRHLNMDRTQVSALSWWERKLYLEGFQWEFGKPEDNPYEPDEVNDGSQSDLDEMGFTTRTV